MRFIALIVSAIGAGYLAQFGEMTEWLKVHAWKVCMPQKGIVGSNPAFSAKLFCRTDRAVK